MPFSGITSFINILYTSRPKRFLQTLAICTIGACSTDGANKTTQKLINPQDLLTVDCLLAPQVRQLGTYISYLAPRRGIRTSGAQCALRGGEYVSYDRADFKSALTVWLPRAQEGDPEAQTYVGEIHEKGLGTPASYETAAAWYEQAAEQNYARAQINLGYLYESGLGVERDITRALNLYRQASGFTAAELEYVSSIEVAKRRATTQQVQQLQTRVQSMNAEIAADRALLTQKMQHLLSSEQEVLQLRKAVNAQQAELVSTPTSNASTDQVSTANSHLLQTLQNKIASAQIEKTTLIKALAIQHEHTTTLEAQMFNAEKEIDKTTLRLRDAQRNVDSLENLLEQNQFDSAQSSAIYATRVENAKSVSSKLQLRIATLVTNNQDQSANMQEQLHETAKTQIALNEKIEQQNFTIGQLEKQRTQLLSDFDRKLTQTTSSLESVSTELRAQLQTQGVEQDTQRRRHAVNIDTLQRKLELRETNLQTQTKEIETLQRKLSTQQARLTPLAVEQVSQTVPSSPSINIIDPPVLITRGKPTLTNSTNPVKLIGKVEPADSLFAFRINGQDHPVSDYGLFQFDTTRAHPDALNLLAINNQGASTRLSLSLGSDPVQLPADMNAAPSTTIAANTITETNLSQSLDEVDFGTYHALIIGNDTYDSLSDLRTAGNDAITVERIFREKYGFRTTLLLNANQKTLLSALERMRASLGRNDNLVIYYAGHGEFDRQSGRSYWLPTDAAAGNRTKWIANTAITAMIDTMAAKHVLVVADSCYSGTLSRSSIARPLPKTNAKMRLKWLKAVSKSRVRTVLSSGGVRPVLDGTADSEHSVFANEFIDTLQQNNGILEAYRLFHNIQGKVADAAAKLNVQQIPQYAPIRHSGHQAGEFIFVPIAQTHVKTGT